MTKDINALKQVNRSGFPFQLKVEHDVRATQATHRWSVASREHPWRDDEGNSGFIDIVLKNKEFLYLSLGCRVQASEGRRCQAAPMVVFGRGVKASSYATESALDGLRDDPRFKAMLKRMNLPE